MQKAREEGWEGGGHDDVHVPSNVAFCGLHVRVSDGEVCPAL